MRVMDVAAVGAAESLDGETLYYTKGFQLPRHCLRDRLVEGLSNGL